ncbi:prolyl oligopeptidase family serine peptidase [Qipengyuania xiapuensis]|uniref:Prolyl oligopeptidase family serine peptidase n=1 Tax=Qipengyuania xiapuensis TaxID=2867236 RepID=A0ABX8ZV67_9SPHN|nr:prolyl oligopeptidase family serine peptidase [Qipengyuania xiapuensis]QZD92799.1 prolyl oligopeptidase family serine peptidase [Qipengyuania xiapuensis]
MKTFASIAALAAATIAAPLAAQSTYDTPPAAIADIVTRAPSPGVSLSPDGSTMLLMESEALPPVSELAKPMERLAGLRLDAATNDRHNPRNVVGLMLQDVASGETRRVELPANADISDINWSPDGSKIAFTNTLEDGMALMVLDVETGELTTLMRDGINAIFAEPRWMPDGKLLALAIPEGRGSKPVESLTPVGPAIQDATGGEEAQTRTYQDLLKDAYDERLFEWLVTSEPRLFDLRNGKSTTILPPRIYTGIAPSPDGKYLLASWLEKPFSYQVPYYRFPTTTAVYTTDGKLVQTIAEQPLADNLPVQGVPTGRRSVGWHPNEDALLVWAEAQDGGDPRVETDVRDAVYTLAAPFDDTPREIAKLEDRYSGWIGLEESDDLIVVDYDRDTREVRQTLVDVTGSDPARMLNIRNYQDVYADPGNPITVPNDAGYYVAKVDDGQLTMSGMGATPEGYRPFLRRFDLATTETSEIWRNSGENFEYVVGLTNDDASSFLTYYESPTNPGNFRLHEAGDARFVTDFKDPHPELSGIERELITYKRSDGVDLTATLYLPPSYKEGDKLPVVVWAYPREFNDAATAGQVRDSNYRFTRVGGYSHLFFLMQGYAVMDRAAMPVIGDDPETVNDTFIEQIVASAQAAVDESVRRGFGDGERVGVGGHSYGAFMTAHLLAQSDIFRAGIARSGAYNRTLTPFGFQSERRIFWDTPETYYKLSPFMAANKINEPMLLIHGEKDNNSGTFPQQSERMFAAIKGTGGTARLVMLPHESHGYRGSESVLHTLAEMIDWFDTYVKPEEVELAGD